MRTKNFTLIGIFLLIGILVTSLGSCYIRTSYGNYGSTSGSSSYKFDKKMCETGQDFMIQIAPFGCEPMVVRSDLLEEQNVPVFCQLSATKINPLIDVEAIDSISISGKYPEGVSGVGFHPARSALGVKKELTSPILDNIGYAVIVLKKEENASDMPSSVEGVLQAKIKYDVKNAFGIGQSTFYLPELNDNEWNERNYQYSFWKGRGYLRAESVNNNEATISVYDSADKIRTISLEKGKTSEMVYLPGFDCMAGLKVKLNDIDNPDTKVRLDINGDFLEVGKNEKFLNDRCYVRNIKKNGLNEEVEIRCKEDEGSRTFALSISPKVRLDFPGAKEEGYEVGDFLFPSDEEGKNVYLGYIGTAQNSGNVKDLYVRFMETPQTLNKLDNKDITKVARYDKLFSISKEGSITRKVGTAMIKGVISLAGTLGEAIINGNYFDVLIFKEEENIYGTDVSIAGLASPINRELSGNTLNYYKNAMNDYDDIVSRFSGEKENIDIDSEATFGERALLKQIELARKTSQKKTMVELCKKFKERYSDSSLIKGLYSNGAGICEDSIKISNLKRMNEDVVMNGNIKNIYFEGIFEPSIEDYSVEISILGAKDGCPSEAILQKGESACLSNDEYIALKEIKDGYATFDVSSVKEKKGREVFWKTNDLKVNLDEKKVLGVNNYQIILDKININKVAKVSLIPNINNVGTETNFSFKIGIEQRSISLSPEQKKKQIEKVNEMIEDWQKISNQIGAVAKGLKTACLGVGAYMTVKNYFFNTGGKSIARQNVMRGKGGWNEKCLDLIEDGKYNTLNECFTEESDNIDRDVDLYYTELERQNKEIKNLEKNYVKDSSIFGSSIDDDKFADAFLSDNYRSELKKNLHEKFGDEMEIGGEKVLIDDFVDNLNSSQVSIEDLRDLQFNARLGNTLEDSSSKELRSIIGDVYVNTKENIATQSFQSELNGAGLNYRIESYGSQNAVSGVYHGNTISGEKLVGADLKSGENYPIQIITYNHNKYVLVLDGEGKNYFINQVYNYDSASNGNINVNSAGEQQEKEIKQAFSKFVRFDPASYQNKYKNPQLRYYETDPYKGMPALVPFDLNNGWYVSIKQTLPVGSNIASYDASGRVTSFYLCNVGENGQEEKRGNDDICQMVNTATGQPYNVFNGLSKSDVTRITREAIKAVETASKIKDKTGNVYIGKNARNVKVGSPAADIPDVQCQDVMSPSDCQLMFNVCDPVICPASRCNFGGAYPVKDVIQTGIIGSVLLCLPNFREGIYIPICLTGVKAGIDGLLSVFTSYRDCLQDSIDTGRMTGICDEIYSIHLCEFFWRQSVPLAKVILPKFLGFVFGENTRGGGEYMGVSSAWETAEKSADYFVQYYAVDSAEAFKTKISTAVGDAVCKGSISASYPSSGSLLSSLTELDSPPQFYGKFEEIPFTSATNPPISQYKVYYHIFAGKSTAVNYKVYLKGSGDSSYYKDTALSHIVDSGYIPTGETIDKAPDFTAPSGYKELCIAINGQEQCGFKQVSTEYTVNYVNDKYMEEQTEERNIKTENGCISGSVSAYSLLTPSMQGAAESIVNPAIYNRGIIRICATRNPGEGTDSSAGGEDSRWIEVGYCDDENIKCWLDRNSVKDVIKDKDIENEVLEGHTKTQIELLKEEGKYFTEKEFNDFVKEIDKLNTESEYFGIVQKITEDVLKKSFLNREKAYLYFLRGNAFYQLALLGYKEAVTTYKATITDVYSIKEDFMNDKKISYGYSIGEFDNQNAKIFKGYRTSYYIYYDIESDVYTIRDTFSDEIVMFGTYEDVNTVTFSKNKEKDSDSIIDELSVYSRDEEAVDSWILNELEKVSFQIDTNEFIYKDEPNIEPFMLLEIQKKTESEGLRDYRTSTEVLMQGNIYIQGASETEYFLKKDWVRAGISGADGPRDTSGAPVGSTRYDYGIFESGLIFDDAMGYVSNNVAYTLDDSSSDDKALILDLNKYGIFNQDIIITGSKIAFATTSTDSARKLILGRIADMDGQIVPSTEFSADGVIYTANQNCYTSTMYIYDTCEQFKKCVYSDSPGKKYSVIGTTIKTSTSLPFLVNENPQGICSLNKQYGKNILSEDIKLNAIQPGDLLSIVYDSKQGHNVIFVEWIDKEKNIAKIFDWNGGGYLSEGQRDSAGNTCTSKNLFSGNRCKVYGYLEYDLSDNSHPVYFYWAPSGATVTESTDIISPPPSRVKWTLETALTEADKLFKEDKSIDYSDDPDVKSFLDQICEDKILTENECNELKGIGLFNVEEDLEWVVDKLRGKKAIKDSEDTNQQSSSEKKETSSSEEKPTFFTLKVDSEDKLRIYRKGVITEYYLEESDTNEYNIMEDFFNIGLEVGSITYEGDIQVDEDKTVIVELKQYIFEDNKFIPK